MWAGGALLLSCYQSVKRRLRPSVQQQLAPASARLAYLSSFPSLLPKLLLMVQWLLILSTPLLLLTRLCWRAGVGCLCLRACGRGRGPLSLPRCGVLLVRP
jgi:hypothetical protein